MKTIIATTNAPAAIGPYSQAVKSGNMVFTSGQIPIDPTTGQVVYGPADVHAKQAMLNLKAVLEAAGSNMDKIIKTTVFIKNMDDFAAINTVYASFFTAEPPARSCEEVARLPKDVLVEVEAIAYI